jgi:hemerythrin-like domain-containing protein
MDNRLDKATGLIKGEHRQVEVLFERFRRRPERSTAMQLCDLLERHTEMEEEVLYPELKAVDEELYDDAVEEHEEADQLIEQIRSSDDLDRIAELVAELQQGVQHHVEDEETEDLPAMHDSCGTERMDELGQQMEQWRSARGGGGPGAMAGRDDDGIAEAADKEALLDLTKDELYEKAQEADIAGRSNMSKDELAEELAGR